MTRKKYLALIFFAMISAGAAYGEDYFKISLLKRSEYSNLDAVRRGVKMCWIPPKGSTANVVVARFFINNLGQVSKLSIVQSSGDKAYDEAAVSAIEPGFREALTPGGRPTTGPFEITFERVIVSAEQRAKSGVAVKKAAELVAKKDLAGAEKMLNDALANDTENRQILKALHGIYEQKKDTPNSWRIMRLLHDAGPQ